MSIYVSFFSEGKKKLFSKDINFKKMLSQIEKIVKRNDGRVIRDDDFFSIEICPSGVIDLRYEDNRIVGDAQTNVSGPGFHKAVIDLLDEISTELKIDIDVEDEISYANTRDFQQLQLYYQGWLESFIKEYIGSGDIEIKCMYVSWPFEEWIPIEEEGLITHMGIYNREVCERIIFEGKINIFAKNFFPWFNAEKDAFYYRGMALYLMWNEFCWVKPRNEKEIAMAERILSYIALSRKMDNNIRLPIRESQEIAAFLGKRDINISGPELSFSRPIGYRRKNIIVSVFNDWRIIVPGKMLVEAEEEGISICDEDKEIHISGYEVDEEHPPFVLKELSAISSADSKSIDFVDTNNCHYKAKYKFVPDKKFPPGKWVLTGQVMSNDSIIIASINWTKDSDTKWALDTFCGIRKAGAK